MKQFVCMIGLILFLEPGLAVDDNYQTSQADGKTLILAMPGKKPVTINPNTGEIKEITPKAGTRKENPE
jgi:hypothetical protein